MLWLLAAWVIVGACAGVVVGRGILLADRRSPGTGSDAVLTTADLPNFVAVR